MGFVARSERFELPTLGFEVRCSIQLSYERFNDFNVLGAVPNVLALFGSPVAAAFAVAHVIWWCRSMKQCCSRSSIETR